MERLKVLQVCYDASWIQPLLQTLEAKVDILRIKPTKRECSHERMTAKIADVYRKQIEEFKPDIIHVHGTENNFGQLQHFFPEIPVVVSIQGVMTGYIPYATARLTPDDMRPYKTLKNTLHRGGLLHVYNTLVNGSKAFEEDILKTCRYFFCRTDWDRMWVKNYNPNACIYQGEELLRSVFYEKAGQWNNDNAVNHSIFMPSGFNPVKGLHHAIRAVAKLKESYPDVTLRVPGIPMNIYNRTGLVYRLCGEEYLGYVRHLIDQYQLHDNVILLPRLSAEDMANEMLSANVFLSPSSIDNSPNAVGEAMMLGLPIVSTPVGGVTSFVHHEENGLLAEPEELSNAIGRLFDDKKLATTLSSNAYHTALQRHDKEKTAEQYISAYKDILKQR